MQQYKNQQRPSITECIYPCLATEAVPLLRCTSLQQINKPVPCRFNCEWSEKMWNDFKAYAYSFKLSYALDEWYRLFKRIDSEQHGYITVAKLVRFMSQRGFDMQQYKTSDNVFVYQLFSTMHRNGKVNSEQFIKALLL